jgi:hypothetical protein
MSFFTGKKLLLIGMFLLLLIGIPVTLYVMQQQTEDRSRAEKSTVLSYTPASTPSSPIQQAVGDEFTVDLMVTPGTNLVSFVSFEVNYDPQYVEVASSNGFVPNTAAFPTTLEGPTVTPGKITGTLSVGAEPTRAIQTPTKAGTITFKALKATGVTPTQVKYIQPITKVLSIGSNDQFSEDVLSSVTPAYILITGEVGPSTTPAPTSAPLPTAAPQPTAAPNPNPNPNPNPGGGIGTGVNVVPVCSTLTVSPGISGNAPLTVQFTAEGNDQDGTISKISYNFGDGEFVDITDSGGVGTATVSAQTSHTFTNPGTFQVTSLLTDDVGGVSTTTGCNVTITVLGGSSPAPTLEPTGPGSTILGIGAIVAIVTAIGGFFFFSL